MNTRRHPNLYLTASLVFVAVVFVAFARNFYLARLFSSRTLPPFIVFHGIVMSGWVALVAVQSALIAARKLKWHRNLGVLGAAWAGLVVVLGCMATLRASAREVSGQTEMVPLQLAITGLELVQMALFLGFVVAAVALRRQGASHKRLMLLTIACMLPSVFPRLPFALFSSITSILLAVYATMVLGIGFDTYRHQRLHPAFAWGGAAYVISMQLAFLGVRTNTWQQLLGRLVS